jgi:chemotaxis protein methyltransferase CheR
MALKEMSCALDGFRIEILATDLSNEVLAKARAGIYSQFEVQRGLPIHMLLKYFTQSGETWQISPEIRSMVQFRPFNLLTDFSRLGLFDLVMCRNVLIYFDQPMKSDVLDRLSRVVASDGYLVLGSAETTIGLTQAFASMPDRRGLYSPVHNAAPVAMAQTVIGSSQPIFSTV